MTEFSVVELPRLFSREQATEMVGGTVGPADPNVTTATVAVDAASGEPVFAYLPLGDVAELRRAVVLGTSYGENMIRANGVRNKSRTFGYGPRRPVYRREGCSATTLANEAPDAHRVITSYSDRLAEVLAEIDPRLVDKGRAAVAEVMPDWRLGESKLWTSGVINQSAVLPWHRDAFNFPAWSAMPVLRRHITGGYLRIPEYGATVACRDGWGVFFAGYELLHGVTPMRLTRPDGYRYSIVFYALKGMKNCFEAAAETAYARKRRTEREQDMARRLAEGEKSIVEQGRGLPLGRGSTGRRMGNREVLNERQDEQASDVVEPPRGRPAGFDPKLARKKGFRLMGGRGQGEFTEYVEPPGGAARQGAPARYVEPPNTARKVDLTGDPTAIEDVYVAERAAAAALDAAESDGAQ